MPDILDATGLTLKTLSEIVANLTTAMQTIYGSDINVDQNSPDGQMINIFSQSCIDIRELIANTYNSFDPDRAVGTILDERVVINNIERRGGTFTIQPIDITVSTTVNLQGLDANFNNVNGVGYTIQDSSGNQYILETSATLTAGTTTANFRAMIIGAVTPIVNTITIPVTIVPGVTSVNNSVAPLSIGENEETDAQLRVRRQQSVALGSTGYLNGLLGFVLSLPGVTAAVLYENVTNADDGDGIPAHGIWLIVEGGSTSDIANAIYDKKSYGANMKGSQTLDIITASGGIFTAKWDVPSSETLYLRFNIQPTTGVSFNLPAIKSYIVANLSYTIGQYSDAASLTALAQLAINANGGGGLPTEVNISNDGSTWVDYLPTSAKDKQWSLVTGNISITVL